MKFFWRLVGALLLTMALASQALAFDYPLGDEGIPPDYDQYIQSAKERMGAKAAKSMPSSYNWMTLGKVTVAKDQKSCGSCWAFASVGAFESKLLIAGKGTYDLSEQQQVSCNTSMSGCSGGSVTALQFWYNVGPMLESCTGYSSATGITGSCSSLPSCTTLDYRTKGFYTVDTSDNDEIKSSLYTDGPTYFRWDVYGDFDTFWRTGSSGQVYKMASGDYEGGHAVLIIGWDDSKGAWLCKNSWGATAGPNGDGTFWIGYSGHATDVRFGMGNVQIYAIEPPVDLGEALDNDTLSFNTSGDGDWYGQTTTFYYGGSAAQSGTIGNNQSSVMSTTVTGPGTFSFYWKVSSEENYDFLKFTVDGETKQQISGATDWAQVEYELSEGSHTITWLYAKDNYVESGSDCGWVDKVEFGQSCEVPAKPTGVTATSGTHTDKVALSWTAVSGAESYKVYRATSIEGPLSLLASPTTNSYDDTGATAGTTYYYWITAVNSCGASSYSDPVTGSVATADYDWTAMTSPSTSLLTGVACASGTSAVAVGYSGTILGYDGSTWTSVTSGVLYSLWDVWVDSGGTYHVAGDGGTIMSGDGTSFSSQSSSVSIGLTGIHGTSSSDIWTVGNHYTSGSTIVHYDGSAWSTAHTDATVFLRDIWAASATSVFAVGSSGAAKHYDGSNWLVMETGSSKDLHSVWGSSASNVFAVGADGTVLRYDGSSWSAMSTPTSEDLYGVWGYSSSDVYAVGGGGVIIHYDGSAWSAQTTPVTGQLQAVGGHSSLGSLAVGLNGAILTREAGGSSGEGVPVYRFLNTNNNSYFYTIDEAEKNWIIATFAFYEYQGVTFRVSESSASGLSPVFRFYNLANNIHFFTIDEAEKDWIIATFAHFKYENESWYASETEVSGMVPLYRLFCYDNYAHFYTTSLTERNEKLADPAYKDEGIAYYVWPSGTPEPSEPGFNIPFSGSAGGFEAVSGIWSFEANEYYLTQGQTDGSFSSIAYGTESFSDFEYTVMVKRSPSGCSSCSNLIYVRGEPSPLGDLNRWNSAYVFGFNNDGSYLVGAYSGGSYTGFQPWTSTTAIRPGDFNTIKITASGTSITLYINGVQLGTLSNANTYSQGKVGVGMYTNQGDDAFYIDSAVLVPVDSGPQAKVADQKDGATCWNGLDSPGVLRSGKLSTSDTGE